MSPSLLANAAAVDNPDFLLFPGSTLWDVFRGCMLVPEGPSTQHSRILVPRIIKGKAFGTRVLKYDGYLDPLGIGSFGGNLEKAWTGLE